ncbi:hypothetical protein [Actinotalea subterranea]|uniref:hypothetical protein n=1 Tax=Actinotalea subterranea TaxID=2607497 RepID=UPI001FE6EEEC|nr:hypothetical protein [Actinotalea subterranea]
MSTAPQDRPDARPARRTRLASLAEPSSLTPVEIDLRIVFWIGIGAWFVALGVAAVLALQGEVTGRSVATCATGAGLGFLALLWEHRRRRRR